MEKWPLIIDYLDNQSRMTFFMDKGRHIDAEGCDVKKKKPKK